MTSPTPPPGGPPPQGPKRSRTPWLFVLVAGVAVAVVGGLALVLTGDDDVEDCCADPSARTGSESQGGQAGTATEEAATSGDIDQYGDALAAAIDGQDAAALDTMTCPDADESVAAAIERLGEVEAASTLPANEGEEAGTYLIGLGLVIDGDANPYEATVVEQDGAFCVQGITEDSYAGMGEPG